MTNAQQSNQTPEINLYTGESQHEVFPRVKDLLPTSTMAPSSAPFHFPDSAPVELPKSYRFDSKNHSTEDFIAATDTAALLVLKNGAVRLERYWLTGRRDVQWISFSVAKSFISTLIGIAVGEGCIQSIDDPINRYAPALDGSAYAGVSIRDVLQMSSRVRWNEDYSNPDAEIHKLSAVISGAQSADAFLASIERDRKPGTVCQYNSADTQALGSLLINATGRSITDYMQEKLCDPLGMESPSYWLLDSEATEMAFCGINMTARDFAKLGELFRNNGIWNGQQIVPEDWVSAATTVENSHTSCGNVVLGDHQFPLGYGYQWWIPDGNDGEFSAIGIYNQFVYVDPSRDVVIVKLSANHAYGTSPDESANRELETIEFLRAIARQLD